MTFKFRSGAVMCDVCMFVHLYIGCPAMHNHYHCDRIYGLAHRVFRGRRICHLRCPAQLRVLQNALAGLHKLTSASMNHPICISWMLHVCRCCHMWRVPCCSSNSITVGCFCSRPWIIGFHFTFENSHCHPMFGRNSVPSI